MRLALYLLAVPATMLAVLVLVIMAAFLRMQGEDISDEY